VKVAGAYGEEEDDSLKWLREKAFLVFFAFLERKLFLLVLWKMKSCTQATALSYDGGAELGFPVD